MSEYVSEVHKCGCSWEYGPCEDHGEVLAQREGASARTADELVLVLCHDLVDLGASLSVNGTETLAEADAYAETCRSPIWGTMWFANGDPDYDGETFDDLSILADQLEADSGLVVYHDDGYRIVRPSVDCPLFN